MNWFDELVTHMAAHGLVAVDGIATDDRLQRFHVAGDRPGSRNGWLRVFYDERPTAVYGSWKSGARHVWRAEQGDHDQDLARIENQRQERAAQRAHSQRAAAARAADLWTRARDPNPRHPYIAGKVIRPYNLRQLGDALVVPLRDVRGDLQNLQLIQPDGSKRFLRDGKVRDHFFAVGPRTRRTWIVEGAATACALFEDFHERVVAAMGSGNIESVCAAILRAWNPEDLVIMADDDDAGRAAARRAADRLGVTWVLPEFPANRPIWATDYLDARRLWLVSRAVG